MYRYDNIETQEVWFALQTTVSWLQLVLTIDIRMKDWMNKKRNWGESMSNKIKQQGSEWMYKEMNEWGTVQHIVKIEWMKRKLEWAREWISKGVHVQRMNRYEQGSGQKSDSAQRNEGESEWVNSCINEWRENKWMNKWTWERVNE
jgi:hypothetical protein